MGLTLTGPLRIFRCLVCVCVCLCVIGGGGFRTTVLLFAFLLDEAFPTEGLLLNERISF